MKVNKPTLYICLNYKVPDKNVIMFISNIILAKQKAIFY